MLVRAEDRAATLAGAARHMLLETARLRVALLRLEPGERVAEHAHERSDEVFYFASGTCTLTCGDEELAIGPGDVVTIPAGAFHSLEVDDSPLVLFAAVAPNADDLVTRPDD